MRIERAMAASASSTANSRETGRALHAAAAAMLPGAPVPHTRAKGVLLSLPLLGVFAVASGALWSRRPGNFTTATVATAGKATSAVPDAAATGEIPSCVTSAAGRLPYPGWHSCWSSLYLMRIPRTHPAPAWRHAETSC
jgi:hypothetical protein